MAPFHSHLTRRGPISMAVGPVYSWSYTKVLGSPCDHLWLHRGHIQKRMAVVPSGNKFI